MTIHSQSSDSYPFDPDEICDFVNNPNLSETQLQEAADILGANVELPTELNADGTVVIDAINFNDSFGAMRLDMIQMFG